MSPALKSMMESLLTKCWSDNPKEVFIWGDIWSNQPYLEALEDARKEDNESSTKDRVFNLQKRLKKSSKRKWQVKCQNRKNELKKFVGEVTSQNDFIHARQHLHGSDLERRLSRSIKERQHERFVFGRKFARMQPNWILLYERNREAIGLLKSSWILSKSCQLDNLGLQMDASSEEETNN